VKSPGRQATTADQGDQRQVMMNCWKWEAATTEHAIPAIRQHHQLSTKQLSVIVTEHHAVQSPKSDATACYED